MEGSIQYYWSKTNRRADVLSQAEDGDWGFLFGLTRSNPNANTSAAPGSARCFLKEAAQVSCRSKQETIFYIFLLLRFGYSGKGNGNKDKCVCGSVHVLTMERSFQLFY